MWKNNNLSIVLALLFLLTLGGHSVAGWKAYNQERTEHERETLTYGEFLASPEFGETVFENWESEFFQMGAYILLTVVLFQNGSSESKKFDGTDEVDADPEAHRNDPHAPGPVRAGGWQLALYKRSLTIAFGLLFLGSFLGHAWAGARRQTLEARDHGSLETITMFAYMHDPQFWYESFQNWQSEFLAVLSIVTLSIWFRQWGSPESKPVHAPHSETVGG